jgi:hypothetical protein
MLVLDDEVRRQLTRQPRSPAARSSGSTAESPTDYGGTVGAEAREIRSSIPRSAALRFWAMGCVGPAVDDNMQT